MFMKKIVTAICGLAIVCWGVASLRSGALKADNLLQESSVVETTVPESSTVAAPEPAAETESELPVEPSSVPETPAPEAPATEPAASPEAPAEQPLKETAPVEKEEAPETTETSTVESSENEGESTESSTSSATSSESSTSASSTSQTSSTTNSSTSTSGTSTSSSASSSSTSSSSGGATGTTTSSSTTPPATGQEPPQSSTPPAVTPPGTIQNPAPNTPTPPAPSEPKVQTSTAIIQTTPEAFSETSTLQLPSDLKTAEVAQSDLKGYELPLLSSFENEAHAALIYDGIKKLGIEQEESFTAEQLATTLYSELFATEIIGTPEKQAEEISIGSLLYQKKKEQFEVVGVYIGKDYYLTVEDVEVVASESTAEDTNEEAAIETKDETEDADESNKNEKQRQVVLQPMDIDEELFVQALPNVTLTEYGQTILKEYPASINFTENEASKKFIETIAEDARKLGQEYDVFASVMIAQALLESGSGSSSLSLPPNYNLFGVKGTYQGQAVSMATQEDRGNGELYSINSAFRKYPNYAASLGDYVQLLRGGISGNSNYYQKTWRSTAKNYLRSTHALTGTYATDTSYDRKLNSIIAVYNLTQYDRVKVDQSSGVFIKGKDEIPEEYRSMMRYPDYNGVNYNTSGSYPVGQCTWYAYNRVKQLGKSVDDFMGNGGEWGTKGKALGYEVSREPKAGWLISFTPGTAGSDPRYGHVAFVEVVRPEGILISEGNVYGGTVISYRVIDANLAKSDLVTYIKAK